MDGDLREEEIATSRILPSHPQLVKGEGVREFPNFPEAILTRKKTRSWPMGVWEDPGKASAEKEALLKERVVGRLADVILRLESMVD